MNRLAFVSVLAVIASLSCSSGTSEQTPAAAGSSGASGQSGAGGSGGAAQGGSAGAGGVDAGVDGPGDDACASCTDAIPSEAAGTAGPYEPCSTPDACQAGYKCVTTVTDPEYGQCTKDCGADTDCPASPSGNGVGCHPDTKICYSLCGVHGGTCPDGLVCTAQEFCLEPSLTVPTKGPGEHCIGSAECKDGAECVQGEYTAAYCAPKCQKDEDCTTAAPGSKGTCTDAGTFTFCMYYCGMMAGGAKCPGDMVCEGNAICR
ncbi:MAG: hypothetical protein HY898_24135 [Deltaproteobacteria bacterium]|nr:hypothetical protein [Deltaproteobacteria bacterium]